MSINSRCGRTDTAVRAGIAARLTEIQNRADAATDGPWKIETHYGMSQSRRRQIVVPGWMTPIAVLGQENPYGDPDAEFVAASRTDVPALTNAVESVMDYVARCEESGITMQPGDVRRLIAAALGGAS